MTPVRLGAVSYLNTKPLVAGLEDRPDLFAMRFDVPARCADLLHEGTIDVGLIPVTEYRQDAYDIVPEVAIGSNGIIASVALFSLVPLAEIRSLALDESSRTSVALTKVLCKRHWNIAPAFTRGAGTLAETLAHADAALVIGDPALAVEPDESRLRKIDLGAEWQALTGLPFVFAVWAGRSGVLGREHISELQAARYRGEREVARLAAEYGDGDAGRTNRALVYLRDNLKYGLGPAECAGLETFFELAAADDLIPGAPRLRFYE